jgi:DNA polymerase elongation subunit (family B)
LSQIKPIENFVQGNVIMNRKEAAEYLLSLMINNTKIKIPFDDKNKMQKITEACIVLNISLTGNGCLFSKNKHGFLPELMISQIKLREFYKKKKKEAVKNGDALAEIKYDKAQLAKKIQNNSLYGSLSNVGFRFYDVNLAEAITLSGQLSIRYMEKKVNDLMNQICKTSGIDYIIAVDTDSLYIRFKTLVDMYCEGKSKTEIINFLDRVSKEKIEPFISEQYELLAKGMNSYSQNMEMKREVIGDKALWTGKKHYIINVWDKEGLRLKKPELKIMGIETVKSSTPEICRPALERAIEIVMNEDEDALQEYVAKFKEEFFKASFEDIAFPRTANNLKKYSHSVSIYKKATPIQVRGALIYNHVLKERKLNKISPIFEGEKVKFCYLKLPNPTYDTVISAPGFLPFLDIAEYLDYNTQWEKAFADPLNHILEKIEWRSKREANLEELFA